MRLTITFEPIFFIKNLTPWYDIILQKSLSSHCMPPFLVVGSISRYITSNLYVCWPFIKTSNILWDYFWWSCSYESCSVFWRFLFKVSYVYHGIFLKRFKVWTNYCSSYLSHSFACEFEQLVIINLLMNWWLSICMDLWPLLHIIVSH